MEAGTPNESYTKQRCLHMHVPSASWKQSIIYMISKTHLVLPLKSLKNSYRFKGGFKLNLPKLFIEQHLSKHNNFWVVLSSVSCASSMKMFWRTGIQEYDLHTSVWHKYFNLSYIGLETASRPFNLLLLEE